MIALQSHGLSRLMVGPYRMGARRSTDSLGGGARRQGESSVALGATCGHAEEPDTGEERGQRRGSLQKVAHRGRGRRSQVASAVRGSRGITITRAVLRLCRLDCSYYPPPILHRSCVPSGMDSLETIVRAGRDFKTCHDAKNRFS